MPRFVTRRFAGLLLFALIATASLTAHAQDSKLDLEPGDRITIIGNTLADRMQHHGWLETIIQSRFPEHDLSFRNLGFAGDEITTRPRSANFGSPDQWMTKVESDVVFCFFGYNEALRGEAGLGKFKADLANMLTGMKAQKYNGESAPKIVVFSPIAHEYLQSPHLPDGRENNKKLAMYTGAMADVCQEQGVAFVDIFHATNDLYKATDKPLTMNGVHLLENGNRKLAETIDAALWGPREERPAAYLEKIREAVLDKNLHWFSRYRVVDGYNVYGGRSKLNWHDQSNADVMRREMEIFDVMTANRDKRIWSVARGGDLQVKDDNLPALLDVLTNKRGPLEEGKFPYLTGEQAIEKMDVHEGMKVNLFASEDMFPDLINPVQMAVDTDSRVWVSCWPSYPHWNPTHAREDKLVILPDEDLDGVADEAIVFADGLNSITGFEFWGGGVLVVAPPEIWFLKDTDGDDKADFKLRVLQGVSSADTHHTANALVIGPDGWLYWSRGVFHVTNMETPTKTFRSTTSGVYRFNPRTYEVEFHFPIGPNPHGDVIDRWGYQFVNDGTGGTGSYANIGKGQGNKKWFQKRVRPVPATGILSSSHFPKKYDGNFLICNAIGFLGVAQHEVQYDGADITAIEVDPIVQSSDPNFRPSDVEVGGDGALYIADWHNALIGHMQHNIRDPNRDHDHGRIYRVTYPGRDLVKPAKMKGKPIAEVCENFFAQENSTRYRARLELSGRASNDIADQVARFAATLDPQRATEERDEAQALLECLWVFEEHRLPNMELLAKVFQAEEPRVRAAAIRTLGHWHGRVDAWEDLLLAAARDDSALVRAEAVKAAVDLQGVAGAEVIFEVATRELDAELETVLKYAQSKINADQIAQQSIANGQQLSQAGMLYVLRNATVDQLVNLDPTEAVYLAILSRENAGPKHLEYAVGGLAKVRKTSEVALLLDLVKQQDAEEDTTLIGGVKQLIAEKPASELKSVSKQLESIAIDSKTSAARQLGFLAWMTADGTGENALAAAASDGEASLRDALEAAASVRDPQVQEALFAQVRPFLFDLPPGIDAPEQETGGSEPGLMVGYYLPNPKDVSLETMNRLQPKAVGIAADVSLKTDVISKRDAFALRFTGYLSIPRSGKYNFYLASDDGSRLYIGDELVINHDGLHGMTEKAGSVDLSAGAHPIEVTYYDNGGGDGLRLAWSGPGIKGKQPIPTESLSTGGRSATLHDLAVSVMSHIPGHEKQKFNDMARLIRSGKSRESAVGLMRLIDREHWNAKQLQAVTDSLVAHLSGMPARYRTTSDAIAAADLAKSLATALPENESRAVLNRLENLDVRVIAIGTVPFRMIYDQDRVVVEAGKPVEFRFTNTDHMPHNLTVCLPGSMEEVGLLAESTAQAADAMQRQYIPKTDKILAASNLLQPGDAQAISFEVPQQPGVYPIVCTYPGHWRRMFASLYVVESLDDYQADPEAFFAKSEPMIKDDLLKLIGKDHEWKVEEILDSVKPLEGPRSFDVGKNAFTVASCIACHRMGESTGLQVGPDLTKLDTEKKNAEHILRSLITPSEKIEEKFQSHTFALVTGKVVSGMILEETEDTVTVIENPLAKTKPIVLQKDDIDAQRKAEKSIMPEGLANKLTREEILDLIAYVFAKGDKKHMLFHGGHEHGEHDH